MFIVVMCHYDVIGMALLNRIAGGDFTGFCLGLFWILYCQNISVILMRIE